MNQKLIEEQLGKLKQQIPVNQELKKDLAGSFPVESKNNWKKRASAAIIIAAAACLAIFIGVMPNNMIKPANAAALKIFNQVSFVDIGRGANLAVAEYGGTVYIPIAGEGIFAYDTRGFRKIHDQEAGFIAASHDGKHLAIAADGSLKTLELASGKVTELFKSDGNNVSYICYDEPSWSPDNKKIVYVKRVIEPGKTHGFMVKESGIYEYDLKTGQSSRRLADGAYPSYVNGSKAIVFEKDHEIVYKNIADGRESVIDEGRFPAVSPDGNYVAYVKLESKVREIEENAAVMEDLSNVWIADVDMISKKRVTTNFVHKYVDEGEWLKGLSESDNTRQVLGYGGVYDYYDPVWSSNSESIYVLKNHNIEQNMRLMRIDFSKEKLTATDTIKRFSQALVIRDDDFAKRLMKDPPPMNMTISNPHPVGYHIIGAGNEDGKDYVDAQIISAYTAHPDYCISSCRYYLSPGENGYIIDSYVGLAREAVFSRDGQTIILRRGDKEEILVKASDIPQQYIPRGKYRFASLAYSKASETLVFTIQALQDNEKEQKAAVTILKYNLKNGQFKLIDHIEKLSGKENIGVENLIIDAAGRYAALDLFSDDEPAWKNYCYVYNLENREKINLGDMLESSGSKAVHSRYWEEKGLAFSMSSWGQTMVYIYEPAKKELSCM